VITAITSRKAELTAQLNASRRNFERNLGDHSSGLLTTNKKVNKEIWL